LGEGAPAQPRGVSSFTQTDPPGGRKARRSRLPVSARSTFPRSAQTPPHPRPRSKMGTSSPDAGTEASSTFCSRGPGLLPIWWSASPRARSRSGVRAGSGATPA